MSPFAGSVGQQLREHGGSEAVRTLGDTFPAHDVVDRELPGQGEQR
eukprot:gene10272-22272_t